MFFGNNNSCIWIILIIIILCCFCNGNHFGGFCGNDRFSDCDRCCD